MSVTLPWGIFYLIIFPGFLFTAAVGLFSTWVDRKVSARIQWRVGPPWYQPFVDILKLLGKENIIPAGTGMTGYLVFPIIGFIAVVLVSTILWVTNWFPEATFVGDIIVVIYLLYLPAIGIIAGGSASGNPMGAVGASREMKLMLAYELVFLVAIFTPVVAAGGCISLGGLVGYQAANGWMLGNASCIIAFIVSLVCIQAKLGLVPFDIAEAETEIIAGPYTEYSGAALAVFKLTKAMLLFVLPILLIAVFMGGVWSPWAILEYLLILVLIILVKNTNPRIRVDQAIRFFWVPCLILSVIGIILAAVGL